MNLNVRISGALEAHVERAIREGGYENVSEYVRSLIRADRARVEAEADERLKAELRLAFSAPDSEYEPLSAADIYRRNSGQG